MSGRLVVFGYYPLEECCSPKSGYWGRGYDGSWGRRRGSWRRRRGAGTVWFVRARSSWEPRIQTLASRLVLQRDCQLVRVWSIHLRHYRRLGTRGLRFSANHRSRNSESVTFHHIPQSAMPSMLTCSAHLCPASTNCSCSFSGLVISSLSCGEAELGNIAEEMLLGE
jgi:hypothetical protein